MKKIQTIILTLLLILSFSASYTYASPVEKGNYIIGFTQQIDEGLLQKYNGEVYKTLPMIHAAAVKLPISALPYISKESNVKYIEKDAVVDVDSQYIDSELTNMNVYTSQPTKYNGQGVKVAVLDTGIDYNNPDINVSGGVSFIPGITSYMDDNGHGTHVAGIIAAQDNTSGIRGVAPGVSLYSVKVMDNTGEGLISNVVSGIQWSVKNGMDIINLSLGSPQGSYSLQVAVEYATQEGVLMVAAAGNYEDPGAQKPVEYPAKYPEVISVAAIDKSKQQADFSAEGPEIDFAAPGVDIVSIFLNDELAYGSGTSSAAPFVTGILALYKQAYPDKTSDELEAILKATAQDLGQPGKDNIYGYGLVQAPPIGDTIPPNTPGIKDITTAPVNESLWNVQLSWNSVQDNISIAGYNIYLNGNKIATVPNNTTAYTDAQAKGEYDYQVSAFDAAGNESKLSPKIHAFVPRVFQDVNFAAWYSKSVNDMYNQSLTKGYPGGYYKPNQYISRAEAMVMIGRALNLPSTNRDTIFTDVKNGDTFSGYVQAAVDKKIVSGYPDKTFRPNANITRGEVVSILDQAYQVSGTATKTFSDVKQGQFFYNAVIHLTSANIANGYSDGTFRPNQPVTRAEFAAFLISTINAGK